MSEQSKHDNGGAQDQPRAAVTARATVTRKDRAIYDDAWIVDFLRRAGMITLATQNGGQPYQATLLFTYDESRHAIYLHKGKRGRVVENVAAGASVATGVAAAAGAEGGIPVCLTAAEMGRLLPAATALNFSVEYQSVVVFGTMRPVDDPTEARAALQSLLDRYFPHLKSGDDYRPITDDELDATAVFRVDVEEWSGKKKAVGEDFPGAFRWGER